MDVPIKHIIGTTALIGLLVTTTLAYAIVTSFVETDIRKTELKDISENVALNLVEMINLIKFAVYSTGPMMKILDLPNDLNGKVYTVQLVDGTSQGKGYFVRANLTSQPDVSEFSLIPLNVGDIQLKLDTNVTTRYMQVGFTNTTIACSGIIYGRNDTVIWGRTQWEIGSYNRSIEVGVGWLA